VSPRAVLDAVVKEKIPTPLPGLEPPIIQIVAHHSTTELFRILSTSFTLANAHILDAYSCLMLQLILEIHHI
jgi:hypothetical protein